MSALNLTPERRLPSQAVSINEAHPVQLGETSNQVAVFAGLLDIHLHDESRPVMARGCSSRLTYLLADIDASCRSNAQPVEITWLLKGCTFYIFHTAVALLPQSVVRLPVSTSPLSGRAAVAFDLLGSLWNPEPDPNPDPTLPAPQSPEKLQATLADMAAAVDKERAAAAEAEKRLRGVHARSEQLTKVRAATA